MSSSTQPADHEQAPQQTPSSKRSADGQNRPAKRTTIMRIIGRSMLGVIILVGLAVVINWLLIIPKAPIYTLESGTITPYSLNDRKLNATISFSIRSFNPNRRAAINIDSMTMTVSYIDQRFQSTVPSFSQPPGNQTTFHAHVEAYFISPLGQLKGSIEREGLNLELRLSAKIRYSIEKWSSKRRLLEVYCVGVRLQIKTPTAPFENAKCTVDL